MVLRPQTWGRRRLYAVRGPGSRAYFHLGEREGWILSRLDGRTPVEGLRAAYRDAFGEDLEPRWLDEVLAAFARQGLLEGSGGRMPRDGRGLSILCRKLWGFHAEPFLDRLLPVARLAFTAPAALGGAAVGLAGLAVGLASLPALRADWGAALAPARLPLFYLALSLVVTLHELAHGLACRRFGARVRDMGLYLLYFQPCLYTDVTDSWLLARRSERLGILLAPSLLQFALAGAALLAWRVLPPGAIRPAALALAAVSGLGILWNLNPLLPLDGYHALVEIVRIPNLRRRSFALLGRLAGLGRGGPPPRSPRELVIALVYAALAGAYSLGLLALVVWLAARWVYTRSVGA